MLIEFSASNYRSLRKRQTLTMVASNYYKENRDALIARQIPGLSKLDYLPCAVLMGANASGKSTFLKALETLQRMVLTSFTTKPGVGLPFDPHKLDAGTQSTPTTFEIVFAIDSIRYDYSVSYMREKVLSESLSVYPNAREQRWFTRTAASDENGSTPEIVTHPKYLPVPAEITDLLRDDVLLLSLLSKLKYTAVEKISDWFTYGLATLDRSVLAPQAYLRDYSTRVLEGTAGDQNTREQLMSIIRMADFGIEKGDVVTAPPPQFPAELEQILPANFRDREWKTVKFTHSSAAKSTQFDYEEESAGTQRMFEIAGPIIDVLEHGKTATIDELDASMHPLLVREIVKLFQSPVTNKHGAQLIFTAHCTSVLRSDLLRRDQVWFTEKSHDGATTLYPLSDYKPRKGETVEAGYMVGRYSAVPVIMPYFGLDHRDDADA